MLLTRLLRNRSSYLGNSYYLKLNRYTNTAANYQFNVQINNKNLNNYIEKLQQEYTEIIQQPNYIINQRVNELQPLINLLNERKAIVSNISSLTELLDSNDKEMMELAKQEKLELESKLQSIDDNLVEAILPNETQDSFNSIVLEIKSGVGGQEAMLFAQEIYNLYCTFIANKGWQYEIAEYLTTDLGGLRHASILIEGPQAFKYFKHEAGVHRVQRIPSTEKSGRIHTSTVSVLALPQPSEIDIQIDPKDLKIETKRSTGAGGQHVNTTDSAVRIVHLPTNIAVECQVDRSQIKNRKLALARLRAMLYQKELDQQIAAIAAKRKSQVRSNDRNEKIRTYNYNQDRITDHRLHGVHYHNLKGFMVNGVDLEKLIEQLDKQFKVDRLMELVENS
ncbi:unnamed protein product [Ceutorhynchus assimilis]|uniref:Prokaryotic-type class I peptide chain release factors domain-containing protein n=1 Tax=Ceutorhynchus assimilis TaxID=467358 RepID=A0A9N9MUV7_9CUCU|nr:unnamed protein product [Ceutorhynchus assimilis]